MKELSNIEAELKKTVAYKKRVLSEAVLIIFSKKTEKGYYRGKEKLRCPRLKKLLCLWFRNLM